MIAALRAGKATDLGVSLGVLVLAAVSPAIMGLILISVFAVDLGWFPALGLGDGGFDRLQHLILPAVALAAAAVALVARTTRVSMIRTLWPGVHRDRPQPRPLGPTVVVKHAFRHALIPVVTISGLIAGYLLSGAVIVEYAFGLNGLGSLLVDSVQGKDFAVVQAIALILVFAFLVINLIVDLLYALHRPAGPSEHGAARVEHLGRRQPPGPHPAVPLARRPARAIAAAVVLGAVRAGRDPGAADRPATTPTRPTSSTASRGPTATTPRHRRFGPRHLLPAHLRRPDQPRRAAAIVAPLDR